MKCKRIFELKVKKFWILRENIVQIDDGIWYNSVKMVEKLLSVSGNGSNYIRKMKLDLPIQVSPIKMTQT